MQKVQLVETMARLLDDAAVLIDNPNHDGCEPSSCAEHYWHRRRQEGEQSDILLRDAFSLIQAEAENRGHTEPCREGEYDLGEGEAVRVPCGVCHWLERHARFTNNPPAPPFATVVRERVWNAHQTWHYEGIFEMPTYFVQHAPRVPLEPASKHKLRVSIERNAYDEQSRLIVQRWDGAQWQFIAEHPVAKAECKSISYTSRSAPKPGTGQPIPIGPVHFARDRNTLIELAKDVLW